MKIKHTEDYKEARKSLYPSIGDQLDELWKALAKLDPSNPMLLQIQEIKKKVPKTL